MKTNKKNVSDDLNHDKIWVELLDRWFKYNDIIKNVQF